MKNIFVITFLLSFAIASCGPSAEEIAAKEKAKMDSVAMAAQNALLEKQKSDSIAAVQKEEAAVENEMRKDGIREMKAELTAAEVKLQDIEKFHFGRTASEKEQQILEQSKLIEDLKAQIEEAEK